MAGETLGHVHVSEGTISMAKPRRQGIFPGPESGRETAERWILRAAFVVYLALTLAVLFHHEPWRDEADTWLVARDASPVQLVRFASYVGSPGLWYWLQAPLAEAGLPYRSLGLLNLAFAAAGVALVLWRAPFGWPIRVMFAFSYFPSYEYGVIARSYALAMALLFALAACHARRLERPLVHGALLAALFNTSVHGAIVATPILGVFAWEAWRARTRAAWAGAALGAAGAVIAGLQLLPHPDGQLQGLLAAPDLSVVSMTLAGALFPTADDTAWGVVLGWIAFGLVVLAVRRNARALAVLLGTSAGLWALFVLKYTGDMRHWGFLLLAMFYAIWIARVENPAETRRPLGRAAAWMLQASFVWSAFTAAQYWKRDLHDPFSASQALAGWLAREGITRAPIAAWPAPHCESILPYLPGVRFWYPGTRSWGTHMTWTQACVDGWTIPEDEVVRRVVTEFPRGPLTLVTNQPMRSAAAAGLRLAHTEIGPVMMADEQYFVYRR